MKEIREKPQALPQIYEINWVWYSEEIKVNTKHCKFEGRMSSEKYISLRKRFGRKLDIVRDLKISVEDTIQAYEIQFPQ